MLHLAVTSEEKKTLTAAEEFTWTSFAKVQIGNDKDLKIDIEPI